MVKRPTDAFSVNMSQREVYEAIQIGRARQAAKDERWANNDAEFHVGIKDRSYPHIIGVLAELAFAKITGLSFNKELYSKGDAGADFGDIEIKATTFGGPTPLLIVKDGDLAKGKVAKIYVLAQIDEHYRYVRFVGWTTLKQFRAKRKPFNDRASSLTGTDLQPMQKLMKRIGVTSEDQRTEP